MTHTSIRYFLFLLKKKEYETIPTNQIIRTQKSASKEDVQHGLIKSY